ncbi:hypothetical protein O7634_22230 [Micromonospora sp. WMMD1120]|uniref:hypothetical protein n=1 Tax=Micromonospora sp. WMMD1120 TaxID=3016106 RepID=UPI0024174614|nr:hypothetical protein [Micromonospora sp. WMMD1120]MDG4809474.1 hypothetical protein [Micromonospora sp. WMMD1120]
MTGTPYEVDPGSAIGELAAGLADRLATLRRMVEPVAASTQDAERAALRPSHECAIAVDGLLGRTGILTLIGGALDTSWPVGGDSGWDADDVPGRGDRDAL